MAYPGTRLSLEELRRQRAARLGKGVMDAASLGIGALQGLDQHMLELARRQHERERQDRLDAMAKDDREALRAQRDAMTDERDRRVALDALGPEIEAIARRANKIEADRLIADENNPRIQAELDRRSANPYEQKRRAGLVEGPEEEPISLIPVQEMPNPDELARHLAERTNGQISAEELRARLEMARVKAARDDQELQNKLLTDDKRRDYMQGQLDYLPLKNELGRQNLALAKENQRRAEAPPDAFVENAQAASTALREAARSRRAYRAWAAGAQGDTLSKVITALSLGIIPPVTGPIASKIRDFGSQQFDTDPKYAHVKQGITRNLNAVIKLISGSGVSLSEQDRVYGQEVTGNEPMHKLLEMQAGSADYLRNRFRNDLMVSVRAGKMSRQAADALYNEVMSAPLLDEDEYAYGARLMKQHNMTAEQVNAAIVREFGE